MKKRILGLILVCSMAAASLTGCGQAAESERTADDAAETSAEAILDQSDLSAAKSSTGKGTKVAGDGKREDSIVLLTSENWVGTWDPCNHTSIFGANVQNLVFDHLVELDPDTYEIVPGLAKEWKYEGNTLVMNLREGIKFHDGTDFTAEDAKYSLDRHCDPSSAVSNIWLEPIVTKTVDDYTIEISTESGKPLASLLSILYYVCMTSSEDDAEALKTHLNGTGYYKFNDYSDNTLYLEANEEYWGGAPAIKNVEWKYVSDSATRLAALQSGEADLTERVDSEQVAALNEYSDIESRKVTTTELKHFIFKFGSEIMNEDLVRQAIAYAIDKDTIVNDIMGDLAAPTDSMVAASSLGYAPAEGQITYDPEKAKELLEEAGYPNGEGLPEIRYATSNGFYPKTKEYGEYIVACLNAVGINVKFDVMETSAWNDILYLEDSTDAIDCGWMCQILDPDQKLLMWYKTKGIISWVSDPEIDAVLEKEARELDVDARAKILKEEVYPTIAAKVCDVPLFQSVLIYGINTRVEGIKTLANNAIYLKDAKIVSK